MNNQISWTAPEFEQYQKSKSWFIITGAIAGLLFLYALLTKNFLFALLIGLSYFIITTYAAKSPKEIKISITPKGIKIDRIFYQFENLKSFWIFYDPPQIKELSLRSKKTIMPYIKIHLGQESPVIIRKILIKYLPERKHKESITDNLARQIKF